MSRSITRALLSVSDKTGIVDFATALADQGVELLSTGGTAKALREAGLTVKDVSEFTGFPEMLDGRVKTLHPKVHAGLLFRRDLPEHQATMDEHGLEPIDLVCVNLYPFESTVAREGVTFEEAVEQIDIGGPTMIRSAAKNMAAVTTVVDPADYGAVIDEMKANDGATTEATRRRLAQKVFARVASYNAAIARYLGGQLDEPAGAPLVITAGDPQPLRYGENPHQAARLYLEPAGAEATVAHAEVLHGKAMSYNNYVDGNAALEVVRELAGTPGVSIIKHTNPCGFATGETLAEAITAAWEGDPVSAFGSVIAVTQTVDLPFAEFLKGKFVEAVIAPDFDADALEFLQQKSKQIRLLKLHAPLAPAVDADEVRQINGGWLVQGRDNQVMAEWKVMSKAPFPDDKAALAEFGIKACKHVKSNAILLVRDWKPGCHQVLGMGAGQPNRVDSVKKLAIARAKENIRNLHEAGEGADLSLEEFEAQVLGECILISDAFFPFADNIDAANEVGLKYIVEPGGSVKDDEVVAACDNYGIAMAFTGMRHFLH